MEGQDNSNHVQNKSKCFKCGVLGDLSSNCQEHSTSRACYSCGDKNHFKKDCPKGFSSRSPVGETNTALLVDNVCSAYTVNIQLSKDEYTFDTNAILDSGSAISLISYKFVKSVEI